MSIRLRLTLLYSVILAVTLLVFSFALYTVQAQNTLSALKHGLSVNSEGLSQLVLRAYRSPMPPVPERPPEPERRPPLENLSDEQAFQQLREREIARVLDVEGNLVASPFAGAQGALPLSPEGLEAVRAQQVWWEINVWEGERLLIYNRPVVMNGDILFIVQMARPLAERDHALANLTRTLGLAGLLTTLIACGIGWGLAGAALRPIHRITQTAQAIGYESDFARRVDYSGPDDEVGRLATTFNTMLARLEAAYQRVSQTLSLQRDFVADVSHELRTPLTTIRGNLALLRRDPPLPAVEQAEILTDAEAESERMIRLVNNLLLLARADAGPSLKRERVSVQEVIAEACRQARLLDATREIVEQVQPATVLGDRDALKQIVLILLDNALKHSQGAITVVTEATAAQVTLEVRDAGPGIAPERLPHVFDRFYRGEIEPAAPGFGLGLPIAKSLVESQGGVISIANQSKASSAVVVCFPGVTK